MSTDLTEGSDFFEDGLIPAHEKAPRPPNRKKHDEMLNELSTKIKELEDTRGKANERLRVTRDLASGLRDRRDRVSSEKADLEDRINVVNKAFEAKKDALQKLKWSYVINSEEALDQQIKSLQNELQKNHFKITEERKIVSEIDKLNRSKRAVKEINSVKDDLDRLKGSLKELRDKRDQLFKERGELKRKEDDAKNEMRELRDSLEQMKIQIDTLSSDKRSATTEFRVQEMAHKKYISERREEAKLKRKEEKEAAEAQKMKEWQEIKANEEPFEKERALMSTLIVYCQKLLPAANENSSEDLNSSTNSSEVNTKVDLKNIQQISKDESAPENCTAYRKNDDDDFLFAGVTKKSGNKSKGAKKLKARNLKHNPETYMQFGSLSIQPPISSKEVPIVIEKLKSKKLFLEELAEKEKMARKLNEPSMYVDYLDDDLKLNSVTGEHNTVIKIGKKMKDHKKDTNGSFHPDQFPCLPQPSIKDESIFCF